MKLLSLIVDDFGAYEIPEDSLMATAPKRRDGWWDRRTNAGKAAIGEFERNKERRYREWLNE